MPQPPLVPGVYIHEVPPQSMPIEGVSTSVPAFVGLAPWGASNTPTRISSWPEFARTFGPPVTKDEPDGPFMEGAYLAQAVYGFFHNGGSACWVVRVGDDVYGTVPQAPILDAAGDETHHVIASEALLNASNWADETKPPTITLTLSADPVPKPSGDTKDDSKGSSSPSKDVDWAPSPTFSAQVTVDGLGDSWKDPQAEPDPTAAESPWSGLTLTPGPKYLVTAINKLSKLVQVMEAGGPAGGAPRVPAAGAYKLAIPAPPASLTEIASAVALNGDASGQGGLQSVALADEVSTVCVPDLPALATSMDDYRSIHKALSDFCENSKRMAILDPPQGLSVQAIADWQQNEQTPTSEFATLYWPWIRVMHPVSGHPTEVPPCGHVAGVWARTDENRGVFKAPANEELMGAIGLAVDINDGDQETLNPKGINCIRGFPGRGIRIWGARTLSQETAPEWKYINVRRLFNYVTESIQRGTAWAVFEPNDEALWAQLRVSVTNFLTGVWREGALFGAAPAQAFFVKCDASTNPPDLIEAGQVNIQVGIAPVEPAEFVIFQVSQYQLPAA